jgi:2-oxoglutarate dehydrogenase complex dehydrogenase (E1) component-like enzyme
MMASCPSSRWVQEEPENQGAWYYMLTHLPQAMSEKLPGFFDGLVGITRPPSSAPSVGVRDGAVVHVVRSLRP